MSVYLSVMLIFFSDYIISSILQASIYELCFLWILSYLLYNGYIFIMYDDNEPKDIKTSRRLLLQIMKKSLKKTVKDHLSPITISIKDTKWKNRNSFCIQMINRLPYLVYQYINIMSPTNTFYVKPLILCIARKVLIG